LSFAIISTFGNWGNSAINFPIELLYFLTIFSVYCNVGFLPPDCVRKVCSPQDDDITGHYNCSSTGQKICLEGWENLHEN